MALRGNDCCNGVPRHDDNELQQQRWYHDVRPLHLSLSMALTTCPRPLPLPLLRTAIHVPSLSPSQQLVIPRRCDDDLSTHPLHLSFCIHRERLDDDDVTLHHKATTVTPGYHEGHDDDINKNNNNAAMRAYHDTMMMQ